MSTEYAELWDGKVERSRDGGQTFYKIADVKSVEPPTTSKSQRDRTTLDSPNKTRQYGQGFKDTGDFSMTCLYSGDGYEEALQDENSKSLQYRITLSNKDVFQFPVDATVSVTDLTVESDTDAMMTIQGKVLGEVTFTKATA